MRQGSNGMGCKMGGKDCDGAAEGMAGHMKAPDSTHLKIIDDSLRGGLRLACPRAIERAAMAGKIVCNDAQTGGKRAAHTLPDMVAAGKAVQQDEGRIPLARVFTKKSAGHPTIRLAADTTASSEAVTMFVLTPAPKSLPPGCWTSM